MLYVLAALLVLYLTLAECSNSAAFSPPIVEETYNITGFKTSYRKGEDVVIPLRNGTVVEGRVQQVQKINVDGETVTRGNALVEIYSGVIKPSGTFAITQSAGDLFIMVDIPGESFQMLKKGSKYTVEYLPESYYETAQNYELVNHGEAEASGDERLDHTGSKATSRAHRRQSKKLGARFATDYEPKGTSYIDVLIVYTSSALSSAGSTGAMRGLCSRAVSLLNEGLSRSGIKPNLRARLVGCLPLDNKYKEKNTVAMLEDLKANRIKMANGKTKVLTARNAKKADVIHMLVKSMNFCGAGSYMPKGTGSGTSVANMRCATSSFSTAHEIGHNMGCNHDRRSNSEPGTNHGFCWKSRYGCQSSLMAYSSCKVNGRSCPRITKFSNPRLKTGNSKTGSRKAKNAQTIMRNMKRFVNIRVRNKNNGRRRGTSSLDIQRDECKPQSYRKKYPKCKRSIQRVMKNAGLGAYKRGYDGSRCSAQEFVHNKNGNCPSSCYGSFNTRKYPNCEDRIHSISAHPKPWHYKAGYDGIRCSAQEYLHSKGKVCPPVQL